MCVHRTGTTVFPLIFQIRISIVAGSFLRSLCFVITEPAAPGLYNEHELKNEQLQLLTILSLQTAHFPHLPEIYPSITSH